MYETRPCTGGQQATVKLLCLPGEWAGRIWAGQVCSTKQKAEQSAAEIALAQIMGDPELSAIVNRPPAPKNDKGRGKGKSKGKQFGFKGWGGPCFYGKGWGMKGMDMWNWMGKGWGKGKGPDGAEGPEGMEEMFSGIDPEFLAGFDLNALFDDPTAT
uniref:DRBM domain-containing protein n=1 Tax=Noctiluca scintillans TaxID=2966 RepID=A0A7S1A6J9_NOCSC